MAKEDRKLTSEEYRDVVIYDAQGREILRLGEIASEYEGDDGEDFCQTDAESILGSDGTLMSFQDLMRPPNQGGVTPRICDICQRNARRAISWRNRNVNQFSPAANIRRCHRCSRNLCSRHARVDGGDGGRTRRGRPAAQVAAACRLHAPRNRPAPVAGRRARRKLP